MKKNVTNIKNDKLFIKKINEIIKLYDNKRDEDNISEAELFVCSKLKKIRDVAIGDEELKMPQEKYISFQRALDDMPSIGMTDIGETIYELIYYFAYIYKITS